MWNLAQDYALYADLFKRKGNLPQAKEKLKQAIEIYKECGADGWVEMAQTKWQSLDNTHVFITDSIYILPITIIQPKDKSGTFQELLEGYNSCPLQISHIKYQMIKKLLGREYLTWAQG